MDAEGEGQPMRSRLDQWLFPKGPGESLALFRVLLGCLLVFALLGGYFDPSIWADPDGIFSSEASGEWNLRLGHWNPLVEAPTWAAWVVWWSLLGAGILFVLGWFPQVCATVVFLGLVMLHHRTPVILFGADTLLRLSFFWMIFAPSGDTLRLLLRPAGLAQSHALDPGKSEQATVPPDNLPGVSAPNQRGLDGLPLRHLWPQRFLQLQWALMYFTTFLGKTMGETWRIGEAAWYPPRLEGFARFPVPAWIDQTPFLQIQTYGALAIEFALATLIFVPRFRTPVVGCGLLLHAMIEWRLNIPMFAALSVAGYVLFFTGEETARFLRRCSAFVNFFSSSGRTLPDTGSVGTRT